MCNKEGLNKNCKNTNLEEICKLHFKQYHGSGKFLVSTFDTHGLRSTLEHSAVKMNYSYLSRNGRWERYPSLNLLSKVEMMTTIFCSYLSRSGNWERCPSLLLSKVELITTIFCSYSSKDGKLTNISSYYHFFEDDKRERHPNIVHSCSYISKDGKMTNFSNYNHFFEEERRERHPILDHLCCYLYKGGKLTNFTIYNHLFDVEKRERHPILDHLCCYLSKDGKLTNFTIYNHLFDVEKRERHPSLDHLSKMKSKSSRYSNLSKKLIKRLPSIEYNILYINLTSQTQSRGTYWKQFDNNNWNKYQLTQLINSTM